MQQWSKEQEGGGEKWQVRRKRCRSCRVLNHPKIGTNANIYRRWII